MKPVETLFPVSIAIPLTLLHVTRVDNLKLK